VGFFTKLIFALAAVSAIPIVVLLIWGESESTERDVRTRPIVVPANGYIGSESCRECHQDQFQSWHASYHRTMTQVVSEETAPQVIWNSVVEVEGESYEFTHEGDEFYVRFHDPVERGALRMRQIVMMTGSHHMHGFWYESRFERTPALLPIIYLIDQQRWIPRRSAFLRIGEMPGAELGRWNAGCSKCHSTHPRQRRNSETKAWDTHVGEFGIACEACHGPGEEHVAFQSEKSDSQRDDIVVNPVDLPHESKSDLCGQCHGIGLLDYNVMSEAEYLSNGSPFRPGMTFDQLPFCSIVQASPEHWDTDVFKRFATSQHVLNSQFWADGEVRVSGREYNGMIESQCFKQGQIACISCHTMHEQDQTRQGEWKDDQLIAGMQTDQACLQCHNDYAELGSAHTHHPLGSSGSECMNCHMPHTVYGLLKSIRSHRISSPSVQTTIQTGRANACNLCHLDQTLQWASDHLAEWYGQQKPELTKDEQTVSAAVLHMVKGDAAQRALQVANFARPQAVEISGSDWMYPYLLLGMDDPYEAIRIISERSLRELGLGRTDFHYDFLDSPEQRSWILRELEEVQIPSAAGKSALLFNEQGRLQAERVLDLLQRRNKRIVTLLE
jgi:hypothetical protein